MLSVSPSIPIACDGDTISLDARGIGKIVQYNGPETVIAVLGALGLTTEQIEIVLGVSRNVTTH